ncbi:H-2 class II histocompatibility antigen gamma chain [Nibea albiflora]|uniref:H-2 class II histocompatibility antigen gamma chain n=1 Tax=Nibea albiflora TaxID=240163 RepID=A0ACB7EDS2_NIBAL|nr:H-2 class II histocompatibility antigen gamma chain [Nibea albiflora]
MSDPETPNQPLLQAATNVPAAQRGNSYRAYKVAGLTLLACLLIAGQAMIAYFLLNQRSDIKSLEEQNSNLQAEMTKGRSAPRQVTDCQLEAAGKKPVRVPGFHPSCDERGLYQPQQCFMTHCWCVNPANGQEIPGTIKNGQVSCSAAFIAADEIASRDQQWFKPKIMIRYNFRNF